jgi:GTP-binding protein HflX
MNLLTKSEVFIEDKLFATLDTTVRKMVISSMPFLMSDTVGFIRKLPHHLIESFKSTLSEVRESDILLHVIDVSHPKFEDQIRTVNLTLRDLNAQDKTIIHVFNKLDQFRKNSFDELLEKETEDELMEKFISSLKNTYGDNIMLISAKNRENIDELRELIRKEVEDKYKVRFPFKTKYW